MAGRGRMRVSQQPGGVALLRGGGGGGGGSGGGRASMPPPPPIIEQKLAAQHLEIQRLLTENQRFAASHVALRQEIAAAQHELLQLRQLIPDKDAKILNLESDLDQARDELKSISSHRQELHLQAQQLGQELHRARLDAQQMHLMRAENDALRQELQRTRAGAGGSKPPQLQQQQQMPENDLLKEVDKLRSIVSSTSTSACESWSTHYAPNGAIFYYNTLTGVTQWERPAALSAGVGAMSPQQVNSLQQTIQQLMHQQQQQGFHLNSPAAAAVSSSAPHSQVMNHQNPISLQVPPHQQLMFAPPGGSSSSPTAAGPMIPAKPHQPSPSSSQKPISFHAP